MRPFAGRELRSVTASAIEFEIQNLRSMRHSSHSKSSTQTGGPLREGKNGANESIASGRTRSSHRCAFATARAASAPSALPRPPAGFASLIVADFPPLFAKFGGKRSAAVAQPLRRSRAL
jgi:hypothetical protein